jgi:large subunit ribosomal protein L20
MTRVKGGNVAKNRRRKVLKRAKGYFGSKHRLFKTAQEQLMHSGHYAYRDRKMNKRNFRKLWITRINAACRMNDISYSRFINGLTKAGVIINRKMLSEVAIDNAQLFTSYVNIAKDALAGKVAATKVEKANKEVKAAESETVAENTDLNSLKVAELREMAEANGIKDAANMKKAELVEALSK